MTSKCKTCGHKKGSHQSSLQKRNYGTARYFQKCKIKNCKCEKFKARIEKCKNCGHAKYYHKKEGCLADSKCKKFQAEDEVRITDFNRDMGEDERKYYGEEFDENR